jgi:hypothetical protein
MIPETSSERVSVMSPVQARRGSTRIIYVPVVGRDGASTAWPLVVTKIVPAGVVPSGL